MGVATDVFAHLRVAPGDANVLDSSVSDHAVPAPFKAIGADSPEQ
jgi:hypothetical protein